MEVRAVSFPPGMRTKLFEISFSFSLATKYSQDGIKVLDSTFMLYQNCKNCASNHHSMRGGDILCVNPPTPQSLSVYGVVGARDECCIKLQNPQMHI